jgi:hypothetical protein
MSVFVRRTIGVAAAAAAVVAVTVAPASAASAHSAGQSAGQEYFLITIADGHQSVVAHGAFTDAGKDVDHDQSDTLRFSQGALVIHHPDSKSHLSYTLNKKTCFVSFKITGKYTLGAGTGRYAGLTGRGIYVVREQAIAPRKNGACNLNTEPSHLAGYVKASGPVSWS